MNEYLNIAYLQINVYIRKQINKNSYWQQISLQSLSFDNGNKS